MRRHLIGLGLGVVMFLVMFFGGAWGYLRLLRLPAAPGAPVSALPAQGGSLLTSGSVITSIGAVVVTGLIAGILIAWPRISPLATGLPGLIALGWTALFLGDVKEAVDLIPLRGHAFGAGWEALLFNGILGLAGLAMIIPMCLPARWRDPYAEDDEAIEADVSNARDYVADLKATMAADPVGPRRRNATDLMGARPGGSSGGPAGSGSRTGSPAGDVLTDRPLPSGRPRMTGAHQRLAGDQQRLSGGHPRVSGGQPRVASGQQRPTGAQQRLTGGQRSTDRQQHPVGSQARITGGQQGLPSGRQKMTAAELSAQLRSSGTQRRLTDEQ